MSGISTEALSQLVSEKSSGHPGEKVVHINSILRFAVLREGHAFNAIGGSWDAEMDGGDPSTGDLSLIRTVTRSYEVFSFGYTAIVVPFIFVLVTKEVYSSF